VPKLVVFGQTVQVYTEVCQKISIYHAPPFKVAQGHRNWHRSMG